MPLFISDFEQKPFTTLGSLKHDAELVKFKTKTWFSCKYDQDKKRQFA